MAKRGLVVVTVSITSTSAASFTSEIRRIAAAHSCRYEDLELVLLGEAAEWGAWGNTRTPLSVRLAAVDEPQVQSLPTYITDEGKVEYRVAVWSTAKRQVFALDVLKTYPHAVPVLSSNTNGESPGISIELSADKCSLDTSIAFRFTPLRSPGPFLHLIMYPHANHKPFDWSSWIESLPYDLQQVFIQQRRTCALSLKHASIVASYEATWSAFSNENEAPPGPSSSTTMKCVPSIGSTSDVSLATAVTASNPVLEPLCEIGPITGNGYGVKECTTMTCWTVTYDLSLMNRRAPIISFEATGVNTTYHGSFCLLPDMFLRAVTSGSTVIAAVSDDKTFVAPVYCSYAVIRPFRHKDNNLRVVRSVESRKDLHVDTLVGHRGIGRTYTESTAHLRDRARKLAENSLESFIAACDRGCKYVEFDAMLSKDLVPVVFHDPVLLVQSKESGAGANSMPGGPFASEIPLEGSPKWSSYHDAQAAGTDVGSFGYVQVPVHHLTRKQLDRLDMEAMLASGDKNVRLKVLLEKYWAKIIAYAKARRASISASEPSPGAPSTSGSFMPEGGESAPSRLSASFVPLGNSLPLVTHHPTNTTTNNHNTNSPATLLRPPQSVSAGHDSSVDDSDTHHPLNPRIERPHIEIPPSPVRRRQFVENNNNINNNNHSSSHHHSHSHHQHHHKQTRDKKKRPNTTAVGTRQHAGKSISNRIPSLYELFEVTPPHLGMDLEVKFPFQPLADYNLFLQTDHFEINKYCDTILETVYRYSYQNRAIVFCSFDPDICVALMMKQSRYHVLYLSDTDELTDLKDYRSWGIEAPIQFAVAERFAGISIASISLLRPEDQRAATGVSVVPNKLRPPVAATPQPSSSCSSSILKPAVSPQQQQQWTNQYGPTGVSPSSVPISGAFRTADDPWAAVDLEYGRSIVKAANDRGLVVWTWGGANDNHYWNYLQRHELLVSAIISDNVPPISLTKALKMFPEIPHDNEEAEGEAEGQPGQSEDTEMRSNVVNVEGSGTSVTTDAGSSRSRLEDMSLLDDNDAPAGGGMDAPSVAPSRIRT